MKAAVNPETPEKISQKHIVVNRQIEAISDVQEAGQAWRSLDNLNELMKPFVSRQPSTFHQVLTLP